MKEVRKIKYKLHFGILDPQKEKVRGKSRVIKTSTDEEGTLFVLELPVGEYKVFSIDRTRFGGSAYVFTDIRFTVAPRKATYIGTLELQTQGVWLEGLLWPVHDKTDAVGTLFKETGQFSDLPIESRVMVIHKSK